MGIVSTFVLVSAAGCMDGDPTTSATPTFQIVLEPPSESLLQLNDCHGLMVNLLEPKAEGNVPHGWETSEPDFNWIAVHVYECSRLSWGSFERGPIFMLQEFHGQFESPESCRISQAGTLNVYGVLESIWFSDSEVADFARNEYGMNSYYAEFNVTESSPGGYTTTVWRWNHPGGSFSEVALSDAPIPDGGRSNSLVRIAWPNNNGGVSYWDFHDKHSFKQFDERNPTGTMPVPMLHGRTQPIAEFIATGEHVFDVELNAKIYQFEDSACTRPA